MLLIKTSLKPSTIAAAGIGVFVDEDIPKGTLIWKYNPLFDLYFEKESVEQMPQISRDFIKYYAALSQQTGKYVLSIDNSRFINHSSINDNIHEIDIPGDPETGTLASKDIKSGEELLINYRTFDANDLNGTDEYLNS